MQIVFEILLLAVTLTFLMAWGTIKKQRKHDELIHQLLYKCEKKVLKAFEHKDQLSLTEIEMMIEGTKASLFWSKDKVEITDARLMSGQIIKTLVDKKILTQISKNKFTLIKE
ncbi:MULTISPECIES: hypothetical protein [unclassified Fusibacter]|uniref:hypothetical protein n=1 Tax=unclassified Fusibacter TaxID=2624464 RepID=UPI0010126C8A|nr:MULTISPECIES: hypothetical protein [unclassified Fusibacter]MCK8058572.1 hypothetical protein [Fusibacter sp. A2]NPE22658.1 hypothetical protein [Fusibacter sp. A1]RXV60221.1 hypothetical protein DWB64_12475 [Fusibacter sp. A1]